MRVCKEAEYESGMKRAVKEVIEKARGVIEKKNERD